MSLRMACRRAQGRAGSPLPAASLERTRSVLLRRRARSAAPYHHRPDTRLGVRGQAQRDTALGEARINAELLVPGESAGAARLCRRSPRGLARCEDAGPARQCLERESLKNNFLRNLFLCEEVYCRPSGQVLAKNSRNDFETISPVEQQQIDIAELRSKCASKYAPTLRRL